MRIDDRFIGKSQPFALRFCSGCAIGPKYQPPVLTPIQSPVAYKEFAGNDQWKMATPSDALMKGKWWEIFGDPQLNKLEEMVNINNQNVKQAEAQFPPGARAGRRRSRQLLSDDRLNACHHAKRHGQTGGPRFRRNLVKLFAAIHRQLGAGSLGPRASFGPERGRQRAGQRRRLWRMSA